jgi:nucleotide-binding universal stress UspA family protein
MNALTDIRDRIARAQEAQAEMARAKAARRGLSVLHPTDFGPSSTLALAHAVALSLKAGGRLTLLHIRGEDDPAPTRNGLAPLTDLLVKWGRLAAHERFADLKPRFGVDARFVDVPARSISEGLSEHIEAEPIDLAVLATTARSGLSYWFAGSVSRRVLRQAEAMILFVREGQRGLVDPSTGVLSLKRVLIALDGHTPAAPALTHAAKLLDALGSPLEKRLLHVGAAAPADAPPDIPITLAQGSVVEAILQTAQIFKADLIVMPTPGRRGLLSRFRNSVSAAILDDGRWPVLSVPAL